MEKDPVVVTDELERRTSSLGVSKEEARAGKKYVRTFLFSMSIDSPLAQMHVLTRFVLAMATTLVALLMIRTDNLDPAGLLVILAFTLLLMYLSGIIRWVMSRYAIVVPIAMTSLGVSWVIFNPVPGRVILANLQVYSGIFSLHLGFWDLAFILTAVPVFLWRKNLTYSFLLGLLVGWLVYRFLPLGSINLFAFPFLSEWRIIISDQTLYTAFVKVLGFSASAFIALALFMAIRDVEVSGAMVQLGLPYSITFFTSLAARSFSMAMNDYSIIDQAQVSRGRLIPDKTVFEKIKDFGSMAVPLIVVMITRSNTVAASLRARGFSRSKKAEPYRDTYPFHWYDWLSMVLSPALLIAIYLTNFNLTKMIFPGIPF